MHNRFSVSVHYPDLFRCLDCFMVIDIMTLHLGSPLRRNKLALLHSSTCGTLWELSRIGQNCWSSWILKVFAAFLLMLLSLVHTALSGHCGEAFSCCAFQERMLWWWQSWQWKQCGIWLCFLVYTKTYNCFTCWSIFKAQTKLL